MIWDCHYRGLGANSTNNQATQPDEHFVFVDDVAAGTKRSLFRFPWDTDYIDGGANAAGITGDVIYNAGLSNASSWTYTIDAGASVTTF